MTMQHLASRAVDYGQQVIAWMQRWWRPVRPIPESLMRSSLPRGVRKSREQFSIAWEFRSSILDRLDEYFAAMRLIRQSDPDGAAIIARVGLSIPGEAIANPEHESRVWTQQGERLGMGGALLHQEGRQDEDDDPRISPTFLYFQSLKSAIGVERASGEMFKLSAVWDLDDSPMLGQCYVDVKEGDVRLLRELTVSHVTMRTRDGNLRWRQKQLAYPEWLRSPGEFGDGRFKVPSDVARYYFLMAYWTAKEAQDGLIVRAKRNSVTAAFAIGPNRGRVFFADREADALAADGKRRRIFHAVRQHARLLKDGAVSTVKAHYRGLRHFTWNGYAVSIVLPKNADVATARGLSAVEMKPDEAEAKMMNTEEVGIVLDNMLSA